MCSKSVNRDEEKKAKEKPVEEEEKVAGGPVGQLGSSLIEDPVEPSTALVVPSRTNLVAGRFLRRTLLEYPIESYESWLASA